MIIKALYFVILLMTAISCKDATSNEKKTIVEIQGDKFLINGKPTYEGRSWQGFPVEGLLMNSRMVQGIFDDLNPETAGLWKYPDTGEWDADRNTDEFVEAMEDWYAHGLLSFTINLQGGSPGPILHLILREAPVKHFLKGSRRFLIRPMNSAWFPSWVSFISGWTNTWKGMMPSMRPLIIRWTGCLKAATGMS